MLTGREKREMESYKIFINTRLFYSSQILLRSVTILLLFLLVRYESLGISRHRMLRNDIVNIPTTRITKIPWKKGRQARGNGILRCAVKSLVTRVPIKRSNGCFVHQESLSWRSSTRRLLRAY